MIVFVSRTSHGIDDSHSPFSGASMHPSGQWYIEMEPEDFVVWAEAYGPLVVNAHTMPSGERAWVVEIYDDYRE